MTRPSSFNNAANNTLRGRGIDVRAIDLSADPSTLVPTLAGVETLIAAVAFPAILTQIPLATAAKAAGVKRFVPTFYAPVSAPTGITTPREEKEEVLNHVKKLGLPYTVIDNGWWFQIAFPHLPSGRIDYALSEQKDAIAGSGNTPIAHTDLADVGRYVARIIVDPRTLNKMVFAYGELKTQNEIYDLIEGQSGEVIQRKYLSKEVITSILDGIPRGAPFPSPDWWKLTQFEFLNSWGLRGDNTPEYARYFGYIDARELYPDFQPKKMEEFAKELLAGKLRRVYT